MPTEVVAPAHSHADWGSIIAGAVIATAVGLVLLTFGSALGLSVTSAYEGEGLSPLAFAIAAGLWLLWVQVLSFYMGGYDAARLRPRMVNVTEHEVDVRDGLHGFLVWATGVIVAAVIAFVGIAGITTGARTADHRGDIAASVSTVLTQQVGESAAEERTAGPPEASVASADERRAEVARKLGIISAFITAASLLAGAVAAYFGAGVGGRHRDRNVVVEILSMRRPAVSKP